MKIALLPILLFLVHFVQAQTDPTSGLIAYYLFNGNANDESGNGHNAIGNILLGISVLGSQVFQPS
jgi:hypothetical protein